jgi:subfamily B ATP-binding cassette protein MsbA
MIEFLRRIWTFVRPYKTRLFLGIACGIFYALINGALILTIRLVVNVVFPGAEEITVAQRLQAVQGMWRPLAQQVLHWLPALGTPSSNMGKALVIATIPVIMFFRNLFAYLNIYFMAWAAVRGIADLRTQLFGHLQNLSLSFFSQARTGELIARITNDTQVLYGLMGNSLSSMIKDPVTIIVVLGVLLAKEPKLTLISIVVLPVCLVPIIVYGRKVRKSARAMQGHISQLTNLMHESFTANRIVKAYNLEQTVLNQFRETTSKYIGQIMRVIRANEIPSQLTEFLGAVGVALVLIYVVFQTDHTKPPGSFVAFVISIVLMYQPIKSLTKLHNQVHQAAAASQRVFEYLDTVSTVADPPRPIPLRAAQADIHFENVDFDYGEKPVLRGINLTVKAGQLVALVGSSGSGKTTLTNLLLRFYDPQRGVVRIGNTDIRDVAIKDLRRQIALVAQETILFNDTVRGNIAVGSPEATAAQIEAAAKYAYAHEFIQEKSQGYDTMVGEKGIALSGGQRQRIAIARAILKDAPILVLDEATNSLDAKSERAVQADLERLMQGRTTICIAHRLSTIQKADLIVVLDQGRIVESGTHAELLQRRGYYYRLYELQFEPPEV